MSAVKKLVNFPLITIVSIIYQITLRRIKGNRFWQKHQNNRAISTMTRSAQWHVQVLNNIHSEKRRVASHGIHMNVVLLSHIGFFCLAHPKQQRLDFCWASSFFLLSAFPRLTMRFPALCSAAMFRLEKMNLFQLLSNYECRKDILKGEAKAFLWGGTQKCVTFHFSHSTFFAKILIGSC